MVPLQPYLYTGGRCAVFGYPPVEAAYLHASAYDGHDATRNSLGLAMRRICNLRRRQPLCAVVTAPRCQLTAHPNLLPKLAN